MPVPTNGVTEEAGMPSKEELTQCLDRADSELRGASERLASVGQQLQSMRDAVIGQNTLSACSVGSFLQDPPALTLHQHRKGHKNPAEPRFRRASGSGAQGDLQLRLHGRWMELSTQAGAEVAVKDRTASLKLRKTFSENNTRDDLNALLRKGRSIQVFHPQGLLKLCWDIVGLCLLLNDAITIPPSLAWDVTMSSPTLGGTYVTISFWISLVFWSVDLPVNLNTAVYIKGTLQSGRRKILWFYLTSWMLFDLVLIGFDYSFVSFNLGDTNLAVLRSARILRVLRLIRLIKLSKLNTMIEESAAAAGRQWVTMVVAITKTGVGMILVAHWLTCFWYWTGVFLVPASTPNWIQENRAEDVAGWIQYLHSLRWILNAPSPPEIHPASGEERAVDIGISVVTLVVIGSAISKISGTMAELRAMNEETSRRRREVRLYLASQAVSYELVTRIMRFVDYKLEKVSANNMDTSLISPTLQLELYVNQRADYLIQMPIFALAQECYPEIFGSICAAFTKNFYEKGEPVFTAGSYATALHLTYVGKYEYAQEDQAPVMLEGIRWFGELSLYVDPVWHSSTLTPTSFAETFCLRGEDLVACIQVNRGCTGMFCEYAKDFLAGMQKTKSKFGDDDQRKQSEVCCKQNQHFQAAYPDPTTLFPNIVVCGERFSGEMVEDGDADPSSKGRPSSKSNQSQRTVLSRLSAFARIQREAAVETLEDQGLGEFVQRWMNTDQEDVNFDLPGELPGVIPELDKTYGAHAVFSQAPERDRGESACISVLALVRNRYDIFTQPQADNVKLLESQWLELQQIVSWIEPEPEEVHAVLVLLAIRGLGKSKAVIQQVSHDHRRPERAVIYLSQYHKNVVPSTRWLTEKGTELFEGALLTHELFNLAQMLQGENCPGNVKELHSHIAEKGDALFRVYILFLLGFMSGLAGGQGSRFMNAKNADATIGGVRVLQKLMNVSETAIYWGYLNLRAEKLCLPFNSPEDLVLVRLACLGRVQDQKGYESLRLAWLALGERERSSLTDHFLADGIKEQAFNLEFLPNCVANAKANPLIGLTCLLDVLTDLLACLRTKVAMNPNLPKLVPVDLSDMGEFISAVRNRFVFVTCISRCQLKFGQGRCRIEMTGGNWGRATDPDSDLTSIAYTLQDLVIKQQRMEERLNR